MKIKIFFFVMGIWGGHAFSHPHLGVEDVEYFKKYISGEFARRGLDQIHSNHFTFNKIFGGFFLILVSMFFFRWFLIQISSRNNLSSSNLKKMRVLDSISIGFQKSLKLVQVEKYFLLVSVSPIQISLVCKIEDPEMIDAFKLEDSFRQGEDLEKYSFLNWWTKREGLKNRVKGFSSVVEDRKIELVK